MPSTTDERVPHDAHQSKLNGGRNKRTLMGSARWCCARHEHVCPAQVTTHLSEWRSGHFWRQSSAPMTGQSVWCGLGVSADAGAIASARCANDLRTPAWHAGSQRAPSPHLRGRPGEAWLRLPLGRDVEWGACKRPAVLGGRTHRIWHVQYMSHDVPEMRWRHVLPTGRACTGP